MARATDKLTDAAIRAAKPGSHTVKMADGQGLRIEITPFGPKRWRFKYRWGGHERLLSFGTYPTVGLKAARANDRSP